MTDLSLNGPLVQLFISAFVTLFVVIDPPGCVPIFSSLTAGTTPKHRRDMAVRSGPDLRALVHDLTFVPAK